MVTANWKDKTVFTGDNLYVMRGMNSDSVDLVYLDPPFNSNRYYAAPIGSKAAEAAFKDTWALSDVDLVGHNLLKRNLDFGGGYQLLASTKDVHSKGMFSYLIMMTTRLLEIKRILKSTGQVYLHCDPTAGHYLKLVMDGIFGKQNFRNEIIWAYPASPSSVKTSFPRKHDVILRYTKSNKWTFNADKVRIPYAQSSLDRIRYPANKSTVMKGTEIKLAGGGKLPSTVWSDIQQSYRYRKEYLGFPTQKPLKLLQRIIESSSNPGDIVFDPFCGCATALVAAENLGRAWVGVDISPKAAELVVDRIKKHQGTLRELNSRTDIPKRTDIGSELTPTAKKKYKQVLYGIQEGFCNGCHSHFKSNNLEIDHIISRAVGGTDHESNFQLLCGNCNRVKGKRSQEEFKAILAKDRQIDITWIDSKAYQAKIPTPV